MTDKSKAETQGAADLEAFVQIVSPIVAHIEASAPMTLGRYDAYMTAIIRIAGMIDPNGKQDQTRLYRLIQMVLLQAGANRRGVESAMMVLGHG